MLITCPECKNRISDKAKACPCCGFPLEGYQPTEADRILDLISDSTGYVDAQDIFGQKYLNLQISDDNVEEFYDAVYDYLEDHPDIKKLILDFGKTHWKQVPYNGPKCPICGSTSLRKISTTTKVASIAMFGLLSQ